MSRNVKKVRIKPLREMLGEHARDGLKPIPGWPRVPKVEVEAIKEITETPLADGVLKVTMDGHDYYMPVYDE